MTTSGVTAWSMTARDLIVAALHEIRVVALGEEPEAHELAACLTRLNGMLKSWQAKGVTMWREDDVELPVSAGASSTALDNGTQDVVEARLVVSASYHRPLTKWQRADYYALPNRAQTGQPVAFYVSDGAGGRSLHLWPVPAAGTTVRLDIGRMTQTVTDASETVDVPEMWQETVYANLAVRSAGVFGADITPELASRAGRLEAAMLDYDRPDAYFLGSSDYA